MVVHSSETKQKLVVAESWTMLLALDCLPLAKRAHNLTAWSHNIILCNVLFQCFLERGSSTATPRSLASFLLFLRSCTSSNICLDGPFQWSCYWGPSRFARFSQGYKNCKDSSISEASHFFRGRCTGLHCFLVGWGCIVRPTGRGLLVIYRWSMPRHRVPPGGRWVLVNLWGRVASLLWGWWPTNDLSLEEEQDFVGHAAKSHFDHFRCFQHAG